MPDPREPDPYEGVPEVDIDPDFEDDEAGEHLPAHMMPGGDE